MSSRRQPRPVDKNQLKPAPPPAPPSQEPLLHKWIVKVTDDWLPIPSDVLERLKWKEGDELELVPIDGGQQLLLRKKDSTQA